MTIYSFDVLLFVFAISLLFHSSSNCCFLTCIQISQEAGQVVWYSHLFQNLPQFVVIQTVKGFGIVNKAEVDVFSGIPLLFSMIQRMLTIWSLVSLPFLNPAYTSGSISGLGYSTTCFSMGSSAHWLVLPLLNPQCTLNISASVRRSHTEYTFILLSHGSSDIARHLAHDSHLWI